MNSTPGSTNRVIVSAWLWFSGERPSLMKPTNGCAATSSTITATARNAPATVSTVLKTRANSGRWRSNSSIASRPLAA